MLFAFGPEDLERLAVPIGIVVAILVILLVPSARREFNESYEAGRSFREKHKTLSRVCDVIGVLIILGVVVYFVFYR